MTRWIPAAAIALFVLGAPAAYAQALKASGSGRTAFPAGSIEGRVLDDGQKPVVGAMVSVVGRTTAAATTDRDGRYTLRELPFGPYILSVHSRGYFKSRGRTIQLTTEKFAVPEIQIARASKTPVIQAAPAPEASAPQLTQLAGFGGGLAPESVAVDAGDVDAADVAETESPLSNDEGETAWRVRHLPRSVLKNAVAGAVWEPNDEFDLLRWQNIHAAAMAPVALFSELPLSGQLNLMTIDSFDRPGEIFAANAPRSVAFVSVNTRAAGGAWAMQGAMTQGDLSSWIIAGSYKFDQFGKPRLRAGSELQHAALRRRQRCGRRRHPRQRAQCGRRLWIRRVDGLAPPGVRLRHALRPV